MRITMVLNRLLHLNSVRRPLLAFNLDNFYHNHRIHQLVYNLTMIHLHLNGNSDHNSSNQIYQRSHLPNNHHRNSHHHESSCKVDLRHRMWAISISHLNSDNSKCLNNKGHQHHLSNQKHKDKQLGRGPV